MDPGAGVVDFGRAWKAVLALLDNWRNQDREGAQVVDAVCAGLTQSAEFGELAQRQNTQQQQQQQKQQAQTRLQRRQVPHAHTLLPLPTQSQPSRVGCGATLISPLQNNVGRVTNVLELFPGIFDRLRFKALDPVVSRYFNQLEAMLRVFEDTMRSIDLVLQQVQDMVYGHAFDGHHSPKSQQQQQFSENDEPHVLAYKADRTLRQPVSEMDHLDFCEKVATMYRAELVRKKIFVELLKGAVTSDDFAWPFDQTQQPQPQTKRTNSQKASELEDRQNEVEQRAAFGSRVPQLWSTDTSSTSKVDRQMVSEIFAKVLVKL